MCLCDLSRGGLLWFPPWPLGIILVFQIGFNLLNKVKQYAVEFVPSCFDVRDQYLVEGFKLKGIAHRLFEVAGESCCHVFALGEQHFFKWPRISGISTASANGMGFWKGEVRMSG